MKIKFLKPEFPPIYSYLPDLWKVYKNGQFSNRGEMLQRFENELKTYFHFGQKPVCVNNATMGLITALVALKLPKGSKVLVPSFTFAASILAIKNTGLIPVYCDIDEEDYIIALEDYEGRSIVDLEDVSAIMPVCAFGNSIPNYIFDFADKHNLKVIVDAAGAIGTHPPIRADATVYSFHATKTLPVGEGGCIVFKNEKDELYARKAIDFGFDSGRECQHFGLNGKMSEIEAVIGIQALKRLDKIIRQRNDNLFLYELIFKKYIDLKILKFNWFGGMQLLPVLCQTKEFKNHLEYHLQTNGIETRTYYKPCHQNGILSENVSLPVTEDVAERIFCLPFYSSLTKKEFKHIKAVVDNWRMY